MVVLLTSLNIPVVRAQAPKPDATLAIILIRDALTALNQANWTGNYTVLRDYASPNFARANDPVRLTAIFQPIRAQALDLAPVLVLAPKITEAKMIAKGRQLRLTGFFPSRPKQIHFDLIFEPIANRWRLFGISVRAVDTTVTNAQNPGNAPAKPAQKTVPVPKKKPKLE